jgi:putative ABC transport system permease protein
MAVFETASPSLTGVGEPERLDGARVSPNLLRILGASIAFGRDFTDDEEQEGRQYSAILTDSFWRRRFQADPAIVGRTITLDGRPFTVAGVLRPDFRFHNRNMFGMGQAIATRTDLFLPKSFSQEELAQLNGRHNYGVIARLAPGASPVRAAAEMEAVQARMEQLAGEKINQKVNIEPLQESVVARARRGLYILMGAVALLLLLVCANLANLLLARGERRARELAVRAALGAGRVQLARHALLESCLIAAVGTLLACGVAAVALQLLKNYAPLYIPRLEEVRLDARVIAFTALLAAATAALFGLLPAWRAGAADPQDMLRTGPRGATSIRGGARLRSLLVACEAGLGALLLVLAGLLLSSYVRLARADKGFHAPTVLAVEIGLGSKYREPEAREAFYRKALGFLASHPGVESAAIASLLPLLGETWVDGVFPPGRAGAPQDIPVNVRFISGAYFQTMGIPLRAGRPFLDSDRGRKVTLLSAGLAAAFWPGQDAVGRMACRGEKDCYEVVGVVQDVRADAHKPAVPMMYRPFWDWMPYRTTLVARAASGPLSIAGAMRAAVRQADPDVPLPRFRTMADVFDESVATRRLQMLLAAAFAVMALVVACLGIYAVVSYSVARRTAEMGIRAALGARPGDLRLLVLRQGLAPVLAGLLAGLAAAFAAGHLLASQLYEINGRDPLTLAAVAGSLASAALLACLVPALRASRSDPLTALRYE